MIQEVIETKLHNEFSPSHLNVVNESYMHNVPAGSESASLCFGFFIG